MNIQIMNNERPVVYICSPYAGNPKTNTENEKRYSIYAVDAGAIPFASHLLLPLYMKEESKCGMVFTHGEDNATLGSDMSAPWGLPGAMLARRSLSPFF